MATKLAALAAHATLSGTTADVVTFGYNEIITLTSFGGTDSFTLTGKDNSGVSFTTAAFVRGTNAQSSDLQSALRTATGDAALTVAGSTDAGPYTVQYAQAGGYRTPLFVTGTGCTGAVVATDPARRKNLAVTNRDTAVTLYFNFNTSVVPVSAANDTYVVLPGATKIVASNSDIQTVRVVANGTAYSVEIF